MTSFFARYSILLLAVFLIGIEPAAAGSPGNLDAELTATLQAAGFTGTIESTLETRLGRQINPKLANLGRLLWFDRAGGLHNDNTCGGCHSPTNGFGDTQSIAIGIQNTTWWVRIVRGLATSAARPRQRTRRSIPS